MEPEINLSVPRWNFGRVHGHTFFRRACEANWQVGPHILCFSKKPAPTLVGVVGHSLAVPATVLFVAVNLEEHWAAKQLSEFCCWFGGGSELKKPASQGQG
jgi:hypothetical protein